VLLINATPEEEKSMSEEVGVKLKVVNADTPNEVRSVPPSLSSLARGTDASR
jgi:hypothetical protein